MRSLFYPVLVSLLIFILFLSRLGAVGLVGPDEPRYADVARAMFRSGDYITPRLYGEPWFEKSPLYYWLAASLFSLGVNEVNARLPSALFAIFFLGIWFQFARRLFGQQTAILACVLLASTLGWIGFARGAAMDMLLAATLGAALVLLALWFWEQKPAQLWGFYGLLGLATLAKGFVAVALAGLIALAYIANFRQWRAIQKLLWTPAIVLFFAVALPWYLLCYLQNGYPFFEEFIVRHHFERFVSPVIGHPQPIWFYIPILAAGVFPWTPLLALPILEVARRGFGMILRDRQKAFLFYWIVLPFLFFSLAQNKLPNYLLPILPPLSLWIAHIVLSNQESATVVSSEPRASASGPSKHPPQKLSPDSRLGKFSLWSIGISALLLLTIPVLAALLPQSLASGLRRAISEWDTIALWSQLWQGPVPIPIWVTLLVLVVLSGWQLWRKQALEGAFLVLLGVALSVFAITNPLAPSIDRVASVRRVAQRMEALGIPPEELAVYRIERDQRYQLNFYLDRELPDWSPESDVVAVSYVIAAQNEELPHALSVALFPGPKLRVWELAKP
ncbi:MAG: glycosyltransferase family 39 protein [Acidobacteria bacterium]|nr:glycosyltransferase family 39 protein [Acidobacteriota bacterium]